MTEITRDDRPTLVLGGTGKTGRRVVDRLGARGLPVRVGSRSGQPPFDWDDPTTWTPVLQGARAAYIPYPDLITPAATKVTRAFAERALDHDVTRLVLLTGRGEDEAQRAEREVQDTGAEVTVVRCVWFMQIFSEDYLLDSIRAGTVVLPADDTRRDPFVDADDIADVAVAALTEPGHAGQVYELTSPQLVSFPEAIAEIARASGREITYETVPVQDYVAGAVEHGAPDELATFLTYLFSEVLGSNADVADGVQRALGRPPRGFTDYAARTAATGVWTQGADR
ncbi:MAG: NmrA family NAD(P)-binding protein [Jiangellaceae bacterium]